MHTPDPDLRTTIESQADFKIIGDRLHQKRSELNLSIQELTERSGVSAGMISQIERGLANPSLNIIAKLAAALELQLGLFFEQKPAIPPSPVVRRIERRRLKVPDPAFLCELLTPDLNRALEFVWIEVAPGSSMEELPFVRQGKTCGLLLQGTLEVHHGNETYLLHAGDSISFDSSVPHWYRNPGPELVHSVWAITRPPS